MPCSSAGRQNTAGALITQTLSSHPAVTGRLPAMRACRAVLAARRGWECACGPKCCRLPGKYGVCVPGKRALREPALAVERGGRRTDAGRRSRALRGRHEEKRLRRRRRRDALRARVHLLSRACTICKGSSAACQRWLAQGITPGVMTCAAAQMAAHSRARSAGSAPARAPGGRASRWPWPPAPPRPPAQPPAAPAPAAPPPGRPARTAAPPVTPA
jgi:hypothetical protein